LSEWGLDPVYISENWTDEMLYLMTSKLVERKEKIHGASLGNPSISGGRVVSDEALFSQLGKKIKRVK